jgi:Mn-dependent DtxR family transcriptional regulator
MGVIPMLSEVEGHVIEIMRERGGRATVREIAVELYRRGYSPRMASNTLYYLAVKGLVRRAGKGLYELSGEAGAK